MNSIEILSQQLGLQLQARGQTVCTAESCTGGMISAAFTDVAGSSAWFGYGFVTYGNQAKQQLLGVSGESLQAAGAVSEVVVRQMAAGALERAGADWAIAVSGIAGPGGGSPEKPVGTVWFAIVGRETAGEAFSCCFDGDRASVRQQAVTTALDRLLTLLTKDTRVV